MFCSLWIHVEVNLIRHTLTLCGGIYYYAVFKQPIFNRMQITINHTQLVLCGGRHSIVGRCVRAALLNPIEFVTVPTRHKYEHEHTTKIIVLLCKLKFLYPNKTI